MFLSNFYAGMAEQLGNVFNTDPASSEPTANVSRKRWLWPPVTFAPVNSSASRLRHTLAAAFTLLWPVQKK
jgi:hypothetical protein